MARTSPGHLRQTGHDLLGIYLNDHLAGATGGAQLALRAAAAHRGQAVGGAALQQFAGEVGEDRAELIAIMRTLGIALRAYKIYAGWIGERAGRLKLNGHLLSRSPLSSLEELELLRLAVEGKAAGWRTLRTLADSDGRPTCSSSCGFRPWSASSARTRPAMASDRRGAVVFDLDGTLLDANWRLST